MCVFESHVDVTTTTTQGLEMASKSFRKGVRTYRISLIVMAVCAEEGEQK